MLIKIAIEKYKVQKLCVGNILKSIVLTLVKAVASRFDNHIILGGYNVLVETAYNLWIENSLLILYDPTGSHTWSKLDKQ